MNQSEIMMTEGSNFRNLWEFTGDTIDVNGITSNDIYVVLQTYGVEAARRTIICEIQGIFASYGIGVDGRHIELIADYMRKIHPTCEFEDRLNGNINWTR